MRQQASLAAAVGATLLVTLSGCSTTAPTESASGTGGGSDLTTDFGVTDDTITLGVLTDASGVFKATGIGNTHGNELWVEDVNADGGICGRDIELNIQDHGYKADNSVPLYDKIRDGVVGIIQMNGSPILAALKGRITQDQMLTIPSATASNNLDSEAILMIGQTYDVEIINGLAMLQEQGLIKDGDKIGHIYVDSEYGQNSLLGSKYYAEEHGMEVVEASVSSSDTDMNSTITKLKSEGVLAIALAVTPAALGSVALQNVSQGLEVPLIGNNPTYSVTLLQDEATTQALQEHYYFINSVAAYSDDSIPLMKDIAERYPKKYSDPPEKAIPSGYVFGLVFQQILDKACENGDMTRQGVLSAAKELNEVDTKGLTGPLDLSHPGAPTGRQAWILKVDPDAPTGLVKDGELFSSPEAEEYTAPFQE